MNRVEAMEDALKNVILYLGRIIPTKQELELKHKAEAALSLPRRNCDVGTADEQTERFNDFCESNMQHYKDMFGDGLDGWDCKENCPVGKMIDCGKAVADRCQLAWAQMPYTP